MVRQLVMVGFLLHLFVFPKVFGDVLSLEYAVCTVVRTPTVDAADRSDCIDANMMGVLTKAFSVELAKGGVSRTILKANNADVTVQWNHNDAICINRQATMKATCKAGETTTVDQSPVCFERASLCNDGVPVYETIFLTNECSMTSANPPDSVLLVVHLTKCPPCHAISVPSMHVCASLGLYVHHRSDSLADTWLDRTANLDTSSGALTASCMDTTLSKEMRCVALAGDDQFCASNGTEDALIPPCLSLCYAAADQCEVDRDVFCVTGQAWVDDTTNDGRRTDTSVTNCLFQRTIVVSGGPLATTTQTGNTGLAIRCTIRRGLLLTLFTIVLGL